MGHFDLTKIVLAVILLDCTQIHKFTKEPLGTISIGCCLLYFCCFLGGFVGALTTQMRKYANAQIAVPASFISIK